MALTHEERELVAVGASVAAGCKPCTSYHLREVRKAGASDGEIRRAVADAVRVRRDATEIMEARGLGQPEPALEAAGQIVPTEPTRIGALVSVGAAFAVHCTRSLEEHLEASARLGVSEEEIEEVVEMARFIKKMAASHVEKLVGVTEATKTAPEKEARAAGCCC